MKKTLLLLALIAFTFGCAENSEDTIPDPVVPEINIDDQKSTTESKKSDKKKAIAPRM